MLSRQARKKSRPIASDGRGTRRKRRRFITWRQIPGEDGVRRHYTGGGGAASPLHAGGGRRKLEGSDLRNDRPSRSRLPCVQVFTAACCPVSCWPGRSRS